MGSSKPLEAISAMNTSLIDANGTARNPLKIVWYEFNNEVYTRIFDMIMNDLDVDFEYVKVKRSANFTQVQF